MTGRRELLLRFCSALWGLAIGISLLPLWERPACCQMTSTLTLSP